MLTRLSIKNFRSCPAWDFSFWKNTLAFGPNGSWKTHILEWIHILAGWSSVYGNIPIDPGTHIEWYFSENDLTQKYTLHKEEAKESWSINGRIGTKSKYMENLPFRTVLISPFDMNLLYFEPSIRRWSMDSILERSFAQFRKIKRDYELTMRHRNALLKKVREGFANKTDIDYWDKKVGELGHIYLLYRDKYSEFIAENISSVTVLWEKYAIFFEYKWSCIGYENREEWIIEYLKINRERDILTGHTHIWPHRDDFTFSIKNKTGTYDAPSFLSRGEMKMLLLWLKTLEVQFLEKYTNIPVLLLIDDIFAELDEKNSFQFINSLKTYQTILTSQKPHENRENWADFICINLEDI